MKTKLLLLLFMGFTISLNAQIRFVEVNPSTNIIKIKNFGGSTVNIATYQLCDFPLYPELSTLNVTNGSLNLAAGAEVTVDISSAITMDTNNGELGLYINGPFNSSSNMRDYIQWGASAHTREVVANGASIWTSGSFISLDAPLPYTYTGDGSASDNGVTFWDSTLSSEDFYQYTFSLFPNPAESALNFNLPTSINRATVKIYNTLGEEILFQNVSKDNSLINISDLSANIYIVKLTSNEIVQTKRFVKQ